MNKNIFIDHIVKQLDIMSVEQKDAWILTRAKVLSESEQQDFMMSLTGEKIIAYMPTEDEIMTFCEKVENGDIVMEYETHYYEFNSEGRYIDDWITHHNDPYGVFSFLNKTLKGCHDLIKLGEYKLAGKILDKICHLEIQLVEAEDSEDIEYVSSFTIVDAEKEQLLSMDTYEIAYDWIISLLLGNEDYENIQFARKLIDILNLELCKGIQLSDFYKYTTEKFLNMLEEILEKEINEIYTKLEKFTERTKSWRKIRTLEQKMVRYQHLLLDIRKKCKKQNDSAGYAGNKIITLEDSWKEICKLLKILGYKPYLNNQLELEEVQNLCDILIKKNKLEEESWEIRKKILEDIVSHSYYNRYDCYEPIKKLAEKLYITEEETLEFADILSKSEDYAKEGAEIYRRYGKIDRYMEYLETHLDKSSKEYIELVYCYRNKDNDEKARIIAEQGLKNCRDDITGLFIFLLQDAKKFGDKDRYKKLYASAKRRKKVDIIQINQALKMI